MTLNALCVVEQGVILLPMSDDEGLLGGYEVLFFLNNGVCLGTPTAFTIVVSV